jgi:lysozyme
MWLQEDVGSAESIVDGRVHVPITQVQFDALVSFVFNLGGAKFTDTSCTLLRWLNQGLPAEQVADQFTRWVYGTDPKTRQPIKLPGLVRRRAAEKALFLSDATPDLPEAA